MEVRSQYEYYVSFIGSRFEKWWEDYSLSRVNVQKKNQCFLEKITKLFNLLLLETKTIQ